MLSKGSGLLADVVIAKAPILCPLQAAPSPLLCPLPGDPRCPCRLQLRVGTISLLFPSLKFQTQLSFVLIFPLRSPPLFALPCSGHSCCHPTLLRERGGCSSQFCWCPARLPAGAGFVPVSQWCLWGAALCLP